MSGNDIWTAWLIVGIASHFFWWGMLTEWKFEGPAVFLCLLTILPAAPFGPLIFAIEGALYLMTKRHT